MIGFFLHLNDTGTIYTYLAPVFASVCYKLAIRIVIISENMDSKGNNLLIKYEVSQLGSFTKTCISRALGFYTF